MSYYQNGAKQKNVNKALSLLKHLHHGIEVEEARQPRLRRSHEIALRWVYILSLLAKLLSCSPVAPLPQNMEVCKQTHIYY